MQTDIKVTNKKTGLSKTIDTGGYTCAEYFKTLNAYLAANYQVEIVKGRYDISRRRP